MQQLHLLSTIIEKGTTCGSETQIFCVIKDEISTWDAGASQSIFTPTERAAGAGSPWRRDESSAKSHAGTFAP